MQLLQRGEQGFLQINRKDVPTQHLLPFALGDIQARHFNTESGTESMPRTEELQVLTSCRLTPLDHSGSDVSRNSCWAQDRDVSDTGRHRLGRRACASSATAVTCRWL